MNNLSCIGINIDRLMKELLWFEGALANGYQRQLCSSKIIVLKSHDEMNTVETDTHIPLNEEQWEETLKERREKRISDVSEWR